MSTASEEQRGTCFNCTAECDGDSFCSGCHKFVCSTCDLNYDMPFGEHEAALHLHDPDEDPKEEDG